MRILHVLASNGWGGAERVACTLHRLAKQHGHTSMLDGPAIPELLSGVVEDTGEPLKSASYERRQVLWALSARRRRRQFEPDVVHAHLATPGLAGAAWIIAGSTPMVVTFHLLRRIGRWPKDYFAPVQSERVLTAISRRPSPSAFVTVSEADKHYFESVVPRIRPQVIVNAPPLPPVAAKRAPVLPYPPGVLKLLSVGRLNSQKGFDRMLRAVSDPRVRELPWHWIIVGEGEERPRLAAEIGERGLGDRVTLAGFIPAHGLFEQADLVLCPSRFEGMPLVVLEALDAARPVLASSIAAHEELLNPGALLPEDDREWAAALAALLREGQASSGVQKAPAMASQPELRERFWSSYLRLYETVARK
ncbi:MAG TPA: glycosyltransferase [Polyangiaceae bacterium]|nr:glycosyltransferase [Polyangiaceae bacterium]